MKILTEPRQIRQAIRDLLGDEADERIVAVAYVGADALSFLSAPAGVTMYCWPQPGGTNPIAVEDVERAGTTVHFVERLHAKIYWSRARGALIGSANLTANALGEGGLREAVVWLPPNTFEIHTFIESLDVVDDFASKLKWLHAAHVRFMQRNPAARAPRGVTRRLPSFQQWLSNGAGGAEWRLGWYGEDVPPPTDAVDALVYCPTNKWSYASGG